MAPVSPFLAYSLLALSLLLAALPSSQVVAAASYKKAKLTVFMQSAFNVTDFITNPGVSGIGSGTLTATASQFGSMFVYHSPLTATVDPTSPLVGYMQGTGVTASLEGTAFFVSSTATLNTTKYTGKLNIVGISGGKVPITGGTDDFLFVQGYSDSSYAKIVNLNITYQIDLYLYWPR